MLPIETVVGLILHHAESDEDEDGKEFWVHITYEVTLVARTLDELRDAIRTYLESLVPAPKLLSECEEYVRFNVTIQQEVHRVGSGAFTGDSAGTYVGFAKDFKVIQPVEVNRE